MNRMHSIVALLATLGGGAAHAGVVTWTDVIGGAANHVLVGNNLPYAYGHELGGDSPDGTAFGPGYTVLSADLTVFLADDEDTGYFDPSTGHWVQTGEGSANDFDAVQFSIAGGPLSQRFGVDGTSCILDDGTAAGLQNCAAREFYTALHFSVADLLSADGTLDVTVVPVRFVSNAQHGGVIPSDEWFMGSILTVTAQLGEPPPPSVPEPSSLALFGTALVAAAAASRRA